METLRYVNTDTPGYTRLRWGRGFTYRDANGDTVRDSALRRWFESIVIPPAWEDVWISPHRNGHILATGRDDKGRKQYRYHPDWRALQNQKKFDRLVEFGACLPILRRVTDDHLRQQTMTRERVLATVVRLLESTLIRIGNDAYARKNETYGLTTLTEAHAEVDGSNIQFEFVGKSGKEHTILLEDRQLARVVRRCQDIPGYALFQYVDEAGEHHAIDSADVNDYIRVNTGRDLTAKVFRTWGGSALAVKYLCEHCTDADTEAAARACVAHVAEALGNTEAICRQYYIHPGVMDAHLDGRLAAFYTTGQAAAHTDDSLTPEEHALMGLMSQQDASSLPVAS